MQGFKSPKSAQRFLESHRAVYNVFNTQPHLTGRPTLRLMRIHAFALWEGAAS